MLVFCFLFFQVNVRKDTLIAPMPSPTCSSTSEDDAAGVKPPFEMRTIEYAMDTLKAMDIQSDSTFDMADFLGQLTACLSIQTFQKKDRLALFEQSGQFIKALEAIIEQEREASQTCRSLKSEKERIRDCVIQQGNRLKAQEREITRLLARQEELESELEAAGIDLADSRQECDLAQRQASAAEAKLALSERDRRRQSLSLKGSKSIILDRTTNPEGQRLSQTTTAIQTGIEGETLTFTDQQSHLNPSETWKSFRNREKQPHIEKPKSKNESATVIFTLPDCNDPREIRAMLESQLIGHKTGVKASLSLDKERKRAFVRFKSKGAADAACKILTEAGTKLVHEIKTTLPKKNLYYVRGIPGDIDKEDLLDGLVRLNPRLAVAKDDLELRSLINTRNPKFKNAFLAISPSFGHLLEDCKLRVSCFTDVRPERATEKRRCGVCSLFGHCSRECTEDFKTFVTQLGAGVCPNCTVYNGKCRPENKREVNHSSRDWKCCPSFQAVLKSQQ